MNEQELSELRVFAMSVGPFLTLIEKRKVQAFGALMQKFNQNEDTLREVAKLSAINDLESEIRGRLRTFNELGKGDQ